MPRSIFVEHLSRESWRSWPERNIQTVEPMRITGTSQKHQAPGGRVGATLLVFNQVAFHIYAKGVEIGFCGASYPITAGDYCRAVFPVVAPSQRITGENTHHIRLGIKDVTECVVIHHDVFTHIHLAHSGRHHSPARKRSVAKPVSMQTARVKRGKIDPGFPRIPYLATGG